MEKTKNISLIMREFDFEKVHNYMESVNWRWAVSDSRSQVPSLEDIKETALKLMLQVAEMKGDNASTATGGFEVDRYKDEITLKFVIEWWQNF